MTACLSVLIACPTPEAGRYLFLYLGDFRACNTGLITIVNSAWAVHTHQVKGKDEQRGEVFN